MSTGDRCLWTMPIGIGDAGPVTLDGVDAVELAELLDFTADALGWRGADVIRGELAAHLRRWAGHIHPFVGRAGDALTGGAVDSS
jgi:hypothetical protein